MEVQFAVNLIELKQAVRRLLARLPDESEAGDDSIVFKASGKDLEIVVGSTSEVLRAAVVHPGTAKAAYHVFRSIARSLQFHRGRAIAIVLSPSVLKINRTEYRHPCISTLSPARGQAFVGTKPAKLQNV